jgi:hypothetical protein
VTPLMALCFTSIPPTPSAAPATCFSLRERGTVGRAARPSVNSQRRILERHPPRIFPDGGHARAFPHGGLLPFSPTESMMARSGTMADDGGLRSS